MNSKAFSIPVLSLAFFFLASHVGLMLPEFFAVPEVFFFLISGAALIPLWWRNLVKTNFRPPVHPKMNHFKIIFICICGLAACSAILVFGVRGELGILFSVGGKTTGLVLVYLTLMFCGRVYSSSQITKALLIYGICEVSLLYFTKSEWNANTVAMRGATAGIIGFYLFPYRMLQFGSLFYGLSLAFRFHSRTVLIGTLLAVLFMWFANRISKNKEIIFVGFMTAALLLFAAAAPIRSAITTLAVQSLGSSNPISLFFLEDKNEDKIFGGDFLDRQEIWEISINSIKENPLLGIGIGNEGNYLGGRSHNAYLSLAVEGGVFSVLLWIAFYGAAIQFLIFQTAHFRDPNVQKLLKLATCLLLYMLLSAMVESSGVSSISSPNNLICLFIIFWALTSGADRITSSPYPSMPIQQQSIY